MDGSGFIKGRTAFRGYFSAFAFFLPSLCAPLPSSLLAPCSSAQIVPRLHSKMASLVRPRRFQTEAELNMVRRLLGWSPQETAWGIRAGSVPLGDLRAGGFCAVYFAHFHRLGAADLFVLPAAAGGFWPPAPASHTPLHPHDVDLRPPMRDVRGGAALRHSLPPLLYLAESGRIGARSG